MYSLGKDCQIRGLDAMYQQYFGGIEGTFVEVGAYDGHAWSNTYALAEAGWRGVYVEPVTSLYERCLGWHSNHPKVSAINVAVGSEEGEADLYTDGAELFSLDLSIFTKLSLKSTRFATVKVMTLDQVLKSQEVKQEFELLVIDVEGHELKVLQGFDLRYWLPKMVIIEAHETHPNLALRENAQAINRVFLQGGYAKIHCDTINSVYVRNGEP